MDWYLEGWRNYARFSGRARRKEFFYFLLGNLFISFVLLIVEVSLGLDNLETGGAGPIISLWALIAVVPTISVWVRRLHDIGKSGGWYLLFLVPLANLMLFAWSFFDSEVGSNQYGPDPKESERGLA